MPQNHPLLFTVCVAALAVFLFEPSSTHANPSVTSSNPETDEPKPPAGTLQLGAGFDVQNGFVLGAELAHTRLFGVSGLELRLASEFNSFAQQARFTLSGEPALHNPFFWQIGSSFQRETLLPDTDFQSDTLLGHTRAGVAWTRNLRTSVGFRIGTVQLDGTQVFNDAPLGLSAWSNDQRTLSAAQAMVEYASDDALHQDDRSLPVGFRLTGLVERADDALGSEFSFTRAEARGSWGTMLPKGIHVSFDGRLSATWSDSATDVPFFERYRLGTPLSSIPNTLRPTGPSTTVNGAQMPLGGTAMAYGRVLGSVPLVPQIDLYLLTGFEAGAIEGDLTAGFDPKASASFLGGLSWLSPLGPIQAGVGLPVQPEGLQANEDPVFFLNIGRSF